MTDCPKYYVRRTLIMGASAFAISVLAGIAFRSWHEWHTPLLDPFTISELLFVSTVGALAASVMAAPITVLVLITVAIMVLFGARSKRIWLSLSAFVLLGLYWLLMVEAIREFALMD